jgi:hypothetical protein
VSDVPTTPLFQVKLLDYPLDLYLRAQEHADDLIRELTLIANSPAVAAGNSDLPARLLGLVEQLTHQYAGMSDDVEAHRDAAIDRGEQTIDLTYQVPREFVEAVRRIVAIFDEADVYCREGEHLLTLATPPDALAYRRWLLRQFAAQIEDGAPPEPWPQSPEAAALGRR